MAEQPEERGGNKKPFLDWRESKKGSTADPAVLPVGPEPQASSQATFSPRTAQDFSKKTPTTEEGPSLTPLRPDETGAGLQLRAPYPCHILKEDLTSRVEFVQTARGQVVQKAYSPRPGLLWRTFLQRSKAGREHANLERLRQASIACIEPLGWRESRKAGCVPRCWLLTAQLDNSESLKDFLAATTGRQRQRPLRRYGELLAKTHQAGLLSTTFYPRNILIDDEQHLTVCDQPYLIRRQRNLRSSRLARIDLFDAAFSASRQRQLSRSERWRFLRSYCEDRETARRLWPILHRRRRFAHRFHKGATLLSRVFG